MLTLKVEIKQVIGADGNYDDVSDPATEEECAPYTIKVYQKKNDTEHLVSLFRVDGAEDVNPSNKKGVKQVLFNMDNADMRIILKKNQFITSLSAYGKGDSTHTYYLDDEENKQFTEELNKFFVK